MKEHNKYYWDNKKQRTETAKIHTEEMARKYSAEIQRCIENTSTFNGPINLTKLNKNEFAHENVTMEVVQADTVSALIDHVNREGRTALLNFASYKHPGGGFMVGSRAQEESLCHESFLYNVLKEFDDTYYEKNRKDLNYGLYRDRSLYSPDVIFVKNGNVKKCDVLTCAAPNFSAAEKHVTREQNNTALRNRVRFILEIAKIAKVDTFIVGAWGCGVFQQDPRTVAKYFEEECQKVFINSKIHLVFAVIPPLPNQTDNLTPFVELVNDWNSREVQITYDIYLAGPFFNEYESDLNRQAKTILRNRGFNVFVPQEHFVPDGENMPNNEWGRVVFKMDRDAIKQSKFVVALYHGMYSDSGTAWEIGYAYALGKKILIVCTSDDESSLMIVNGCTSVVNGIVGLRNFDFDEFPIIYPTTSQK